MVPFQLDLIIMLLSADWFFECWSSVGIVASSNKLEIRDGCRKLVKDIIATGSGPSPSYYNVDFSESRSSNTESNFRAILKNCHAPPIPTRSTSNRTEAWNERCASMAYMETLKLIMGRVATGKPLPNEKILNAVENSWIDTETGIDFNVLQRESATAWDSYLAGISHEVPTALPDYALLRRNIADLRSLFKDLRKHISTDEIELFIDWYQLVEPKLTKDKLAFLIEV